MNGIFNASGKEMSEAIVHALCDTPEEANILYAEHVAAMESVIPDQSPYEG